MHTGKPSDEVDPFGRQTSRYRPVVAADQRADTELEALMRCPPSEDPDKAKNELLPLRDVLADALDQLTDLERTVFESLVIERRSLRETAADLGTRSKSGVAKIRDRAIAKLQTLLKDHPLIREELAP